MEPILWLFIRFGPQRSSMATGIPLVLTMNLYTQESFHAFQTRDKNVSVVYIHSTVSSNLLPTDSRCYYVSYHEVIFADVMLSLVNLL